MLRTHVLPMMAPATMMTGNIDDVAKANLQDLATIAIKIDQSPQRAISHYPIPPHQKPR